MKKVIAIDLGGTNLRAAIVEGKKISAFAQIPTPKTKNELLGKLSSLISERMGKDISGIGMGSPGPLKNGFIENSPNIPLKNFDLKKFLRKKFNKKIFVENDAKCFALAEEKYGCKKRNFFILTFGTGVGGGIFADGRLVAGKGRAGELGHIIIDDGMDLESYWKKYKSECEKVYGKNVLLKELMTKNDPISKKIISELTESLAQGIASLIHVFDPEVVILAGGAHEAGEKFLDLIKSKVKKYVIFKGMPPVRWTSLKEPGILGASLLVE